MREIIERLTRCGIPENTAIKIYIDFIKRGQIGALLSYVATEERERQIKR